MLYLYLCSSNKRQQNFIIATIQSTCHEEIEQKTFDDNVWSLIELWIVTLQWLMLISKIQSDTHLTRQLTYIYPSHSVMTVSLYYSTLLPLQPAVAEVNPKSVVVCVWTFETNGHGQQSRDNPSRLCKYQSACLELNVNALIWNANCVFSDMLKH